MLCDKQEAKVREEAARYGYEEYATDWREMAADPRIDVVDNCGPDPVHPDPCIAALAAGKHVICEKPMAVSVADARRMRDAAAAAGTKSMCTFNYRFMPAVRLAKDLIAEGKIGTIYQMRVNYLQMAGHDPALRPEQCWYSAWPSFRRPARDRQPRHRPVPLPRRRDRLGLGPGADLQPGAGYPVGRRLRCIGRRRHGRRAGVCRRGHRRDGVLRGGHGKKELSLLGDQRLEGFAPLGPGASQQPATPAWNSRGAPSCWASARSP